MQGCKHAEERRKFHLPLKERELESGIMTLLIIFMYALCYVMLAISAKQRQSRLP